MSASLVGSEMCIRDSAPAPPRRVLCSLAAPAPCRRSPCSLAAPEPPRACLLYTSDAADDM
eukprot:13718979-Alexandrium_andersonii.AAC.1